MKKISDYRQYEESPFHLHGIGRKVVTSRESSAVMISADGEDAITFHKPAEQKVILHDEEQYVKVFRYGLDVMKHLNARAMCLVVFIMSAVQPRKNTVEITRARVAAFSPKLAGASYYVAMTELLDLGFIARSRQSKKVFYVNPNMLFNGDRRGLVKPVVAVAITDTEDNRKEETYA